jgi:hypothetical protein
LSEAEEQVLTDLVVSVRSVLRRAVREGHTVADVLHGYESCLDGWPPRRRDAILEAVRAAIAPAPPLSLIPGRVTDDAIDLSGDAA